MYLDLEIHLLRNTLNIKDGNFEVDNAYYIPSVSSMLINHFIMPQFVTD